jgi:drug/metabolite transporter (DMT)-like permease
MKKPPLGSAAIKGKKLLLYGFLAGIILFAGASLQQIGIVYTTAGKAGFITGLYVVLVPLLGMFFRHATGIWRWFGVILAVTGLYFLSVTGSFRIELGDLLVILSAFFWAFHVLLIARISPRVNAVLLSIIQYLFCASFSLAASLFSETLDGGMMLRAWLPIVYGGVCSVGIGYTLQVVAQKEAHPAHAAIILSMEGVFAVLGGFLLLGERLLPRGILGCALMFAGMLVSQGEVIFNKRQRPVGT